MSFFIGLMSGTSADGIDAALVEFRENSVSVVDTNFLEHPESIRQSIQSLQTNRLSPYHTVAQIDIELGQMFSQAANVLLKRNPDLSVTAIGCHGQTIQHQPELTPAYTLQIGNGAVIAERTGITVVNDFRSRDLVVNGQGAPLAPAFHQGIFSDPDKTIAIINIGGISNISLLAPNDRTLGFDTGPGNTLMDSWCQRHFRQNYDKNGNRARVSYVDPKLLAILMDDDYFKIQPPKSTGQEYFNYDWLVKKAGDLLASLKADDVLATLTRFTSLSISAAINQFCPSTEVVYICGGGAQNQTLLEFLSKDLNRPVSTTGELGIPPDWVEACAFAWLAKQTLENKPVELESITGARKACVLGCIWPA